MRLKALMLVGMVAALPALGQGTLTFSTTPTYVKTPAAGALVTNGAGGAALTGSTFWAQLYYSTTAGGTFTKFGTARNFLTGAGAGFVSGGTVQVPGVAEGANVFIQMKAWEGAAGSSFESVQTAKGKIGTSNTIVVGLGGPNLSPPKTPGTLDGMAGFAIVAVPEPSTIALGLLGAAGLFLRRRK